MPFEFRREPEGRLAAGAAMAQAMAIAAWAWQTGLGIAAVENILCG